jgi:hypothetical protein
MGRVFEIYVSKPISMQYIMKDIDNINVFKREREREREISAGHAITTTTQYLL